MKINSDRVFVDFREIDFMVVSAVRSRRKTLRDIVTFVCLDRTVAWPEGDRSRIIGARLRRLKADGKVTRAGQAWAMP